MSETYGVTENGFVIKRLDTILNEVNNEIKEELGVDVSVNPQSILSVLSTSFSGKIASLWELAQDVYYSQYPVSADGVNLDNAMQYAGILRKRRLTTKYSLKCTGREGTELSSVGIPYGAIVRSITQPSKDFKSIKNQTISRNAFREIWITPVIGSELVFEVEINGTTISYAATSTETAAQIVAGINALVSISGMTSEATTIDVSGVTYDVLHLSDDDGESNNILGISENMLVKQCCSNLVFESVDYGEVTCPTNTITQIVTIIPGFVAVTNDIAPVLGRLDETDIEARQSYLERIMLKSQSMLESITSGIYDNCKGVLSVVAYENDTNVDYTGTGGLKPHSVELIVDGGEPSEIANQIYTKKAAGIQTNGDIQTNIIDDYGNEHPIYFRRPALKYVWFKVAITKDSAIPRPADAETRVKNAIVAYCNDLDTGEDLFMQKMYSVIYAAFEGITNVSITSAVKNDSSTPVAGDYSNALSISISPKERVITSSSQIAEVTIS